MISLLTNRKSALVFVADFSSLLTAIQQVQAIDETLYTTATIETLKIKYNEAVAVYKDRNNTQSVVTAAKNALVQAKNALVACGNSTALKNLTDEIAELPYMIYSKETIEPLLAKYNESLTILSARYIQSEIDTIKTELTLLKNDLVIREDKQELYNTLTEMAQIDISVYSKEKQEAFFSAYNSAMTILNSLDSTEEQVSFAKQSIQESKINLESKDGMHWALWVLLIILAIVGVILLICWIYFGFVEGDWDIEAYPWIEFAIGLILLVGSVLIMILFGILGM